MSLRSQTIADLRLGAAAAPGRQPGTFLGMNLIAQRGRRAADPGRDSRPGAGRDSSAGQAVPVSGTVGNSIAPATATPRFARCRRPRCTRRLRSCTPSPPRPRLRPRSGRAACPAPVAQPAPCSGPAPGRAARSGLRSPSPRPRRSPSPLRPRLRSRSRPRSRSLRPLRRPAPVASQPTTPRRRSARTSGTTTTRGNGQGQEEGPRGGSPRAPSRPELGGPRRSFHRSKLPRPPPSFR